MKINNKKKYDKPELEVHGDLRKITQKRTGAEDALNRES